MGTLLTINPGCLHNHASGQCGLHRLGMERASRKYICSVSQPPPANPRLVQTTLPRPDYLHYSFRCHFLLRYGNW